jgi:hypothetical protein
MGRTLPRLATLVRIVSLRVAAFERIIACVRAAGLGRNPALGSAERADLADHPSFFEFWFRSAP